MKKQGKTQAATFEAEISAQAAKTDLGMAALVYAAHELDHQRWATFVAATPEGRDSPLEELVNAEADDPNSGLAKVGKDEFVNLVAEGVRRYVRYTRFDYPAEFTGHGKEVEVRKIDVSANPAFAQWTLTEEQSALIQHALSAEGFQVMASPSFIDVFYVALPSDRVAFDEIRKRNRKGLRM